MPKGFGPLDGAAVRGGAQPYSPGPRADPRVKAPDDHGQDYLERHGVVAKAQSSACSPCHLERECLDCHAGSKRDIELHPPGYLVFHALEARTNAASCDSCHSAQTFCKNCHDSVRAGTRGPAAPRASLRFHPPSWLGEVAGPNHADEARRNLRLCTSCHQERDCVECHTNVNPHPAGWRQRCRALLRADPRSCSACHADLSSLRTLCL